jgi:DNA-binding beta-propeller fold protein YncE
MFRFFYVSAATISVVAGLAFAQPASFHGPLAGFVYNRDSRTMQPLLGVPGATYAGSAVMDGLDSASVAPGGRWGLVGRSGRSAVVRGLSDLNPAESTVDGLIDAIDRIVWSGSGTYAVLYSSSQRQLQRVHFSESEVVADTPVDLSPWDGPITALTIDPAGRQVVFGVAGSGLYSFTAGKSPGLLSLMAQPAAAAFDETGDRLYAVDADQQRIVEFDSGSAGMEFGSLGQADRPSSPVGMAVSRGARYLMVADSATRAVLVYEIETRNLVNTIPLDFSPSRMEPLSTDSTYLLNGDNSKEWLLVLDGKQSPAVSFVPASGKELQ